MTNWNAKMMTLALTATLTTGTLAMAQQDAAKVHGKVINAAGQPITTGDVEFTKDVTAAGKEAKMLNKAPLGADGTYSATGIAPGDYVVYVVQGDKFADRQQLKVTPNGDLTLDFDMTREEYMKQLTPEERKAIEEFKAKNASVVAGNAVINNLNATLKAVRDDMHAPTPNWDKDVADMKQATTQKPEESILWMTYADALTGKADAAAKALRAQGKPPMADADVQQEYADAVSAYKKGIELNAASKKPSPLDQATAYNQMGNALARAGKVQEAQASYESAVKLMPANAGQYYGNQAAVLFNASQSDSSLADAALTAAEKAIAADPNRPDPYYVKGQMLLQKATVDPKTQKVVLPAGCEDAYQKYLDLAPDGKFAASVKEVLASLNIKIQTHYRAGAKK
ncbi:tetratricopeptide repeat protein [Granulicella cerasi]|uniref:Tetratricopeptide repeat protein n=1 Tax=Granulicella cerasi TaxID=741063 RepID=A0ABW1ZB53_9BACT|nr:tetratricopeptide repeat protein [Granulicella cerasi]